jgi:isoleucyl-tRNA synthetase
MLHIVQAMVRWLAPVLSFTAEEIWQLLPAAQSTPKSVFLATWHEFPEMPAPRIEWDALIALRQAVLRQLEKLREAGTIGAPLEAEVDVYALPDHARRYAALGDELRFLTITSAARVHVVHAEPDGVVASEAGSAIIPGVWLKVGRTAGTKCVRCWHFTPDVGRHAEHPELCGRCVGNIGEHPEHRQHV